LRPTLIIATTAAAPVRGPGMARRPIIADLARESGIGQRFLSPEIILAQSLRRVFIKPGRVNLYA
jgi:hypothetical protein